MELVINKSSLKRERKPEVNSLDFIPGGILNSSFKKVIKESNARPYSVSGIRRAVNSRIYYSASSIETILKVAVFLTLLGFLI
ncbi:MAG: hypothetical protein R3213_03580 [Flavobacteriaceae bacterium]|nr:hypothetical protein [Flavobacteriaceae bacterium]